MSYIKAIWGEKRQARGEHRDDVISYAAHALLGMQRWKKPF